MSQEDQVRLQPMRDAANEAIGCLARNQRGTPRYSVTHYDLPLLVDALSARLGDDGFPLSAPGDA